MPTCGNCKQPNQTVQHVRECYGVGAVLTAPRKPFTPVGYAEITEGFWRLGDHKDDPIFIVQKSESSLYLYTKMLTVSDTGEIDEDGKAIFKADWKYTPGGITLLRSSGRAHQLTEEESVAFGKLYRLCAICGRRLSNEESKKRGIGPYCARKQGWA